MQRFYEGNFGLAEQYFQNHSRKNPQRRGRLGRTGGELRSIGEFDLADHSYAAAAKLVGNTPSILNNEGYWSVLVSRGFEEGSSEVRRRAQARARQRDRDQQSRFAQSKF